jgi:hypothetical protein
MSTGELIVIKPNEVPETYRLDGPPSLDVLQRHVNGYIERVRVRCLGKVRDAYVNEEGLLYQMPFNPRATSMLAPPFAGNTMIVGNLVVWVPDPKPGSTQHEAH